jgi:hypothetical protein
MGKIKKNYFVSLIIGYDKKELFNQSSAGFFDLILGFQFK